MMPLFPRSKLPRLLPDDSTAHAILAFTLDWNANPSLLDDAHVQDL